MTNTEEQSIFLIKLVRFRRKPFYTQEVDAIVDKRLINILLQTISV
jgi:hypothetical protein